MKVRMSKQQIQNKIRELTDDIDRMTETQGKYPTESRKEYIKLLKEKRESYYSMVKDARWDVTLADNEFEAHKPKGRLAIDPKNVKGGKWI